MACTASQSNAPFFNLPRLLIKRGHYPHLMRFPDETRRFSPDFGWWDVLSFNLYRYAATCVVQSPMKNHLAARWTVAALLLVCFNGCALMPRRWASATKDR